MPIATTNPATGKVLRTFAAHDDAHVESALAAAARAAADWRRVPPAARAAVVGRAADVLDRRREEFARLMTLEMGKPVQAARDEAAKCAAACRYYAEHGPRFVAPETRVDDAQGDGVLEAEQRADDHRAVRPRAGQADVEDVAAGLHREAAAAVSGHPVGEVVGLTLEGAVPDLGELRRHDDMPSEKVASRSCRL